MVETIQMTPDELRDASTALEGYRSDLETLLNTINQRVHQLSTDGWRGAAEDAFMEMFDEVYEQMVDQFPPAISNIATALTQTADALEQADEEIASSLSQ